jgi:K+-sensing histidine kinase KdpD
MLEPAARIVGADAAAIYAADGQLLGAHGVIDPERSTTTVRFGSRRLVVQTTPFTPFFGDEEHKLLQAVASLTGLALDRARLFSHEREAREALERANELKTQFVALAAHELRSPLTAVVGFTETLHHRRAQLSAGQQEQMEQML